MSREMKKYILSLCLICFALGMNSHLNAQQIKWMSWEEAVEAAKVKPKKIFVDVYTSWCSYCKKMERETFSNPYVAKYLNENFYPVKFDAQQENDITFNNKIYSFVRRGERSSYHQLAAKIMNGRLSYPTIVFIDEAQEIIQSIPGYRGPLEFELFITYFGEDQHKEIPWSSFKRENENGLNQTPPQINVHGNK